MAIVRGTKPTSNFYILDKSISEDERLSWDERGLLVYLLGKPETWKVSVSHLIKQTKSSSKSVGKARIYAMLSSLESAGYVSRQEVRDDSGKYCGIDYVVHESPLTDLPHPDLPLAANQTLVSIDKPTRNNINKTNSLSIPAELDQQQPENEVVNDMFGGDERKPNDKVCPWEEILDIWSEVMPDKPQPARNLWVGTARAADLSNRWKACFSIKHEQTGKPFYTDKESGLDWWRRFFTYLRKSDWLMGRVVGANGTAFRNMKIDWIVKKGNFVKILENTYHR